MNDDFVETAIQAILQSAKHGDEGCVGDGKYSSLHWKSAFAFAPVNAAVPRSKDRHCARSAPRGAFFYLMLKPALVIAETRAAWLCL